MYCMKCGRETDDETAFCQNCLAEMEKYPVRPGTVVLLPRRREPSASKKTQKRHLPTADEQLIVLRKKLVVLSILLGICVAAIVLMINPTMHYVLDEHVEIGQNYSSVVSTMPPAAPSNPEP